MKPTFATISLMLLVGLTLPLFAQQEEWILKGDVSYSFATGLATGTNGVLVNYGDAVLVADSISLDRSTGEVAADGRVRIQSQDMVWVGEHVRYNFKTRRMEAEQFRAGQSPIYAGGQDLAGDVSNRTYTAHSGYITLDDYSNPLLKVRAKKLVIRPGDRLEAHGATLCIGEVPIFYLPYYTQPLRTAAPQLKFRAGYNSRFGGYVYGGYGWDLGGMLNLKLNADYRTRRGFGGGPDLEYDFGRWGLGALSYYYLHDQDPETNSLGVLYPADRERLEFNWLASPFTNTTFKSRVSYQSDEGVRSEFFEGEYRNNVQPSTFAEARHFWDDFSLVAIASPRVNDFFEAVERLPEVKLSAYRQQIGHTPLFYESESRAGYLRRRFAETNGVAAPGYEATRADTWHQIVLPLTMFGWLNLSPYAGGRATYYSDADGPAGTTQETTRSVFNTGAELSFKAARTWPGMSGGWFNLDGLRHIVEPSANYVYVPGPDALPGELPQFDFDRPSLRLLPNEFPERNAIDSIDSQNVVRLGLNNRLQTKRDGQVEDWLAWEVYTDWRVNPDSGMEDFSDVWSDLSFSPRHWISLKSQVRWDVYDGKVPLAFTSLTLRPNDIWNWRVGHFYLTDDNPSPPGWGSGDDVLSSTFYLKLSENWGGRAAHYFNLRASQLQEQSYTVYRDFRSWTGSLSFRVQEQFNGDTEYAVLFAFSIKALPRYSVGDDSIERDAFLHY